MWRSINVLRASPHGQAAIRRGLPDQNANMRSGRAAHVVTLSHHATPVAIANLDFLDLELGNQRKEHPVLVVACCSTKGSEYPSMGRNTRAATSDHLGIA